MDTQVKVLSIMESRTVSGPAKNLIRFAKLSRPTVDLQVLTYTRDSSVQDPTLFQVALKQAGIPLWLVEEKRRFDFAILSRLKKIIGELRPDIVQTHAPKSNFLYSLLHKRLGLPWIAFHHGYTAEDFKMRAYNSLNRFSLPKADRVVTVCTPFQRDLVREGVPEKNITVLHNSIEEDWIRNTAPGNSNPDGRFTFLCVGRLSTEKGHKFLLEAVRQLSGQTRRPFALKLVGAGPARAEIEALAKSLDLGDRLILVPAQEDVRPIFASANAFVLSSLSEGSPNVLLEAMAAGLPILTTNVGGVPELVGNTALLVPPADPQALCQGMMRLMEDPLLRSTLARDAGARVRDSFHPRTYARKLVGIYSNLTGLDIEDVGESRPLVLEHSY